ncbi:hypothetical protein AGMMS50293_02590 [Spirochaetia bacterium]|nr:hypothetical protein AGMMS50293_02590 [Spirochaetia bacterium]
MAELVRHTHTAGSGLSPEQIAEIEAAARQPYVYDPDCPLFTEKQLAEFRPVNFASWEERARAMRVAGIVDPEEAAEPVLAATGK